MMDKPVVSFLVTVYNGEKFLAAALESVLNQTFQDFELIVINDGSQDQSGEILAAYRRRDARVMVYDQENKGVVASRNRGLTIAQGRYLALMDADDLSMPDRLERQVGFMEHNPGYVLVGSAYELIDEQGATIRTDRLPATDTRIRWQTLFHSSFAHSAALTLMEPIRRHGLSYVQEVILAEDYKMWSDLLDYGLACNFDEPLIKRRIHPDQATAVATQRHQQNAARVSQANIEKLGISASLEEVSLIRQWFYHFPKTLSPDDLPHSMLFLRVLEAFCQLPGLDASQVSQIRGRWVGKILRALPLKSWPKAARRGFFRSIHRRDIWNSIDYTLRWR